MPVTPHDHWFRRLAATRAAILTTKSRILCCSTTHGSVSVHPEAVGEWMPEDQTVRWKATTATEAGDLAGVRLPTVARSGPDLDLVPVMIQGLDGIISHWSAGCERLYGFGTIEAVGRVARE